MESARLTDIEPWTDAVLEKAYEQVADEWDALEEAAVKAQGRPDFND